MNQTELKTRLDIILDKDFDDSRLRKNIFFLSDYKLKFESAETMLDLFSNVQSDNGLKKTFVTYLEDVISLSRDLVFNDGFNYWSASKVPVSFFVLIRLGFYENAFNSLKSRASILGSSKIFELISDLAESDESYFNINQITDLKNIIQSQKTKVEDLDFIYEKSDALTKLGAVAYNFLKKEIKGINLEINRDMHEVQNIIHYLDFDPKYDALLNELDKQIADSTPVVSSGMIGNLRSFSEDLFVDLAKKIASLENEDIPPYEDGVQIIGRSRRYIKQKLGLSDEDNKLIDSYVKLLHNEGGHSFLSNKEYFRLTKNIGVEIFLFILSKFKQVYSTKLNKK